MLNAVLIPIVSAIFYPSRLFGFLIKACFELKLFHSVTSALDIPFFVCKVKRFHYLMWILGLRSQKKLS